MVKLKHVGIIGAGQMDSGRVNDAWNGCIASSVIIHGDKVVAEVLR
jgi:hypothetical protein